MISRLHSVLVDVAERSLTTEVCERRVAMPMLLDRETNFVSAMLTSVRAVSENPVVMLGWAAIISVTMLISLAPAFLGLVFTLPILGHTTWHLYQRAVSPAEV